MSHLPIAIKLQQTLAQGGTEKLAALLGRLDPEVAADWLMSIPLEDQRSIFRAMPEEQAARLMEVFPYYHGYVLLRSRPVAEMSAILDHMSAGARVEFFEELPENAWQGLMNDLAPRDGGALAAAVEAPSVRAARPEPVVEARGVEKIFERPGGEPIQVIAPTDLALEPGVIVTLLGPSGSGKSTLLRMLSGLMQPSRGEVLWHGKPLRAAAKQQRQLLGEPQP